jgi:hypothetical protein
LRALLGALPPEVAALIGAATGVGGRSGGGHAPTCSQCEIEDEANRAKLYGFLDSLDADQCLALRMILQTHRRSAPLNYVEGMVVSLMRRVHKVDPDTGKPYPVPL